MAKEFGALTADELLFYLEIIKNMCFMSELEVEQIDIVYGELDLFIKRDDNLKNVREYGRKIWQEGRPVEAQIRSVALLQFYEEGERKEYLERYLWADLE